MKKLIIPSLLFVFISVFPQTQSVKESPPLSDGKPSDAGMSQERLERIDRMLQFAIDNREIPGSTCHEKKRNALSVYKAGRKASGKNSRIPFLTHIIR